MMDDEFVLDAVRVWHGASIRGALRAVCGNDSNVNDDDDDVDGNGNENENENRFGLCEWKMEWSV